MSNVASICGESVGSLFTKCLARIMLAIFVVDGDTIIIDGEKIRVMGVDTAEIHCRCQQECDLAWQAKAFTAEHVRDGVTLERHGKDKYGRTLARVYVREGDLAALLIQNGLGRPYRGGKREGWCGAIRP